MGRHRLLVAYVLEEAVAAEVNGLRRAFGGPIGRIAPHITLVPPLNLAADALSVAVGFVAEVAAATAPIHLLLEGPGTFAPRTPVLYLAVSGETERLGALAGALGTGPLAPPPRALARPFVAHVTLGTGLAPARLAAALGALGPLHRPLVVDRVEVLAQHEDRSHSWTSIAEAGLGPPAVVGRGGRELAFVRHHAPTPAIGAFLEAALPGRPGSGLRRIGLVIAGSDRDGIVSVATGSLAEMAASLSCLVVAPERRGEGIGTATLARFEHEAAAAGCELVRVVDPPDGRAAAFLADRGYHLERAASLSGTVAIYERALSASPGGGLSRGR